jgi:hypothetical protein
MHASLRPNWEGAGMRFGSVGLLYPPAPFRVTRISRARRRIWHVGARGSVAPSVRVNRVVNLADGHRLLQPQVLDFRGDDELLVVR